MFSQELSGKGKLNIFSMLVMAVVIIVSVAVYASVTRQEFQANADFTVEQNAGRVANEIGAYVSYGKSSIQVLSQAATQSMNGPVIENVNAVLEPYMHSTPFDFVEYILENGWNTMNNGGKPFSAVTREYYKQGIQGRTGIWLNYAPQKSTEVLLDFYTPLYYQDRIVGVLAGSMGGSSKIAPMLESSFYGEKTLGFLCDRNGMIIASTEADLPLHFSLEEYLRETMGISQEDLPAVWDNVLQHRGEAFTVLEAHGDAVICVQKVEEADWFVIQIVPAESLFTVMYKSTARAILIVVLLAISFDVLLYYLIKKQKEAVQLEMANMKLAQQKDKEIQCQLQEAYAKADSANKAKSSFLFSMSHDIRTPMNAIIGFTDMLEKKQEDKAAVAHCLENIRVSSQYLLNIINNVLNFAKIESGKASLDDSEIWDAKSFYDGLSTVFSVEMENKDLTLHKNYNISSQSVYVDITKLQEIFINILSNAIKYTPTGGNIYLTVTEKPAMSEDVCLYETIIEDTGIGMSEEFLPHIFDEFVRERDSTTSGIAGTGLGMGITKKLIDLMHGTIRIDSKLGKGTKVTITLPHRIASVPQQPAEKGQIDKELFQGKRILLAEDNELNAEIAMEILQDYGFVVERASDGIICVDMLEKAEPGYYSLILMDIQMPNMNGYQAAKFIRSMPEEAKKNIPIYAMTANAFEEDRQQALAMGMNGHIGKPVEMDKLLGVLMEALAAED